MRKHRLAERLLVDVIGLEWEHVHAEACRWEHVMSDAVERKLVALLDNPTVSPYGNPIPGLDEPCATADGASERRGRRRAPPTPDEAGLQRLDEFARRGGGKVEVRRIAEHVQVDARADGRAQERRRRAGQRRRRRGHLPLRRRRAASVTRATSAAGRPRWSRTPCWCAPLYGVPVGPRAAGP